MAVYTLLALHLLSHLFCQLWKLAEEWTTTDRTLTWAILNFLTQASASTWTLVASQTVHNRGQPNTAAIQFSSRLQCSMCSSSNKYLKLASILRASLYLHCSWQATNIWDTPSHIEVNDHLGISPTDASFPKPSFSGVLAGSPRGRSLQIGLWQF